MSFKAYFDGSGKSNNVKQKFVTLGTFAGSGVQWDHFTEAWDRNLKAHGADFLHTTDALSLHGAFKGWTRAKVNDLIEGCVTVIERCVTVRSGDKFTFLGLRPIATTVNLKDFRKAIAKHPDIGTPEYLCVIQNLAYCHTYAISMGFSKLQLFFDRNEPFRGHVVDRVNSPRTLRDAPHMKNIIHTGESSMVDVPALQAADLLAWCVNDEQENRKLSHSWQRRLLAVDRDPMPEYAPQPRVLDYARLSKPNIENIQKVKSWKLPPRRAFR
jgi:hypothetical protein